MGFLGNRDRQLCWLLSAVLFRRCIVFRGLHYCEWQRCRSKPIRQIISGDTPNIANRRQPTCLIFQIYLPKFFSANRCVHWCNVLQMSFMDNFGSWHSKRSTTRSKYACAACAPITSSLPSLLDFNFSVNAVTQSALKLLQCLPPAQLSNH